MTAPRLDLGELRRLHEAAGKRGDWYCEPSEGNSPSPEWLLTGADEYDMAEVAVAVAAVNALPALLSIAEAAEALDKQRLANSLSTPESSYLMEIKLGLALRAALAAVRKEGA